MTKSDMTVILDAFCDGVQEAGWDIALAPTARRHAITPSDMLCVDVVTMGSSDEAMAFTVELYSSVERGSLRGKYHALYVGSTVELVEAA